jgi:hypothetical protein
MESIVKVLIAAIFLCCVGILVEIFFQPFGIKFIEFMPQWQILLIIFFGFASGSMLAHQEKGVSS